MYPTLTPTKVQKLIQYVKEGHNALLYINRCHDTGHVPSAASLQSLEHTLIRVHKASNALQVGVSGVPRRSLCSPSSARLDMRS